MAESILQRQISRFLKPLALAATMFAAFAAPSAHADDSNGHKGNFFTRLFSRKHEQTVQAVRPKVIAPASNTVRHKAANATHSTATAKKKHHAAPKTAYPKKQSAPVAAKTTPQTVATPTPTVQPKVQAVPTVAAPVSAPVSAPAPVTTVQPPVAPEAPTVVTHLPENTAVPKPAEAKKPAVKVQAAPEADDSELPKKEQKGTAQTSVIPEEMSPETATPVFKKGHLTIEIGIPAAPQVTMEEDGIIIQKMVNKFKTLGYKKSNFPKATVTKSQIIVEMPTKGDRLSILLVSIEAGMQKFGNNINISGITEREQIKLREALAKQGHAITLNGKAIQPVSKQAAVTPQAFKAAARTVSAPVSSDERMLGQRLQAAFAENCTIRFARSDNGLQAVGEKSITQYGGYCAHAVVFSLNAAYGCNIETTDSACNLGPNLEAAQFTKTNVTASIINGNIVLMNADSHLPYQPHPGDTIVIQAHGNHTHGHVVTFNGKNWCSDAVQTGIWPYKNAPTTQNLVGIKLYSKPALHVQVARNVKPAAPQIIPVSAMRAQIIPQGLGKPKASLYAVFDPNRNLLALPKNLGGVIQTGSGYGYDETVKAAGVIPAGTWTIAAPAEHSFSLKPLKSGVPRYDATTAFHLIPGSDVELHGRGGFYMHHSHTTDNPGKARLSAAELRSLGCPVMTDKGVETLEEAWNAGVRTLVVLPLKHPAAIAEKTTPVRPQERIAVALPVHTHR